MCGIYGLITDEYKDFKNIIKNVKASLNHRGPDSLGHSLIKIPESNMHILLVHTRLRINGDNKTQPITNSSGSIRLIINGEIFNWHQLEEELDYKCTQSDCEIIIPLYEKYRDTPNVIFEKISGQFSFLLVDLERRSILVGRDHIGITPLYYSTQRRINNVGSVSNTTIFSSELKTLIDTDNTIAYKNDDLSVVLPRSYYNGSFDDILNFKKSDLTSYLSFHDYSSLYCNYICEENIEMIHKKINTLLTESVRSQLIDMLSNENGDYGVLLSGGLDSSLIASLVVRLAKEYNVDASTIKTFSIGVNKHSPDLVAARDVAAFLGTDHHEYYFSIEEGIDNLKNVIWYIESYDCTSVRASTAMYMLTKQIKQNYPKIKVLFSGELSDELLCYLYGANAPNDDAFQDETIHLVSNVHYFDCLRANKTCMANSLEVRVPFTDLDYVKYILKLHPKYKRFGPGNGYIEKKILRDSFVGYIPEHILQRKKEQFSDGVSDFDKESNWIDRLKLYSEVLYSDTDFETLKSKYTYNTPTTKEQLLYRTIFCKLFKCYPLGNSNSELTVKKWIPKWSNNIDPSGRVQSFYNQLY